jgi:hypothetical protein
MTAIEWLVKQVNEDCLNSTFIREDLIKQALEIERLQIEEAAIWMPEPFSNWEFLPELGKQYYEQKYRQTKL